MISLPPREDFLERLELSTNDRRYYEMCREDTLLLFNNALNKKNSKVRFSILQSILRQRQICNHGLDLLPRAVRERLRRRVELGSGTSDSETTSLLCELCDCPIPDLREYTGRQLFETCCHLLCPACLLPDSAMENSCPLCNTDETMEQQRKKKGPDSVSKWESQLDQSSPSPKVMALIANIHASQREGSLDPVKRYF